MKAGFTLCFTVCPNGHIFRCDGPILLSKLTCAKEAVPGGGLLLVLHMHGRPCSFYTFMAYPGDENTPLISINTGWDSLDPPEN